MLVSSNCSCVLDALAVTVRCTCMIASEASMPHNMLAICIFLDCTY